jgi:hypothetical protein
MASDTPERTPSAPAPQGRRFERARRAVDERRHTDAERLADLRRRALVTTWLRSLSRARPPSPR